MKTEKSKTSNSIYYIIPAVLCGVLTACVVSGTVFHMVLGGVFGLLSAGFWSNVVQKNEEA